MDEIKKKSHNPFRVVCIDNANKPLIIDDDDWVNEKEEYIVTGMFKHLISGELCFRLLDVNLPEPYKGLTAKRFAVVNSFSVN